MKLAEMKPREVSRLPAEEIAKLDALATQNLERAKALRALVDSALELRYGERARKQLFLQDRVTGTVHVEDGDFDVTVTVPKRVIWSVGPFRRAVERLQKKVADWHKYVAVEYSLSERAWGAMPEELQRLFRDAREENAGKPRIQIRRRAKPAAAA